MAVQGLDEHLPGGEEGAEGSGTESDGGVEFKIHAIVSALAGLKGWPRGQSESEA